MLKRIFYVVTLAAIFAACEKDQIGRYDLGRYLYFTMTEEQDTLLSFSNYPGESEHTLAFEVNLQGPLLDAPQAFSLAVVDSLTTASAEQYAFDAAPLFGARQEKDTIFVTLKRDASLETERDTLVIAIESNDNFTQGFIGQRYITICYDALPAAPLWWDATFEMFFGAWSEAKMNALVECTGINNFTGVEEPYLRRYAIQLKQYVEEHNLTEEDGTPIDIPVY